MINNYIKAREQYNSVRRKFVEFLKPMIKGIGPTILSREMGKSDSYISNLLKKNPDRTSHETWLKVYKKIEELINEERNIF